MCEAANEDGGDESRRALLHAWQRYYGMEPRNDSHLTQQFVRGMLPVPADRVARELVATDFVFKHTLYGEVIEVFLRKVAQRLRRRVRPLSWKATWEIVRFYGPIALRLMCVSSAGVRIPDLPLAGGGASA